MSFVLYLIGFVVLICGFVYGAHLMHVPSHWIVVMVLLLAGVALIKAVKNTRPKDHG